ncbi:hypothetical protein C0216_03670 [Streptomyces globosus]|uniref:Sensor domain-containing protein n=1 Tax=Streptomyces globosus TaxID=68209 RepID=A0A344TVI9_9ACTN|nr:hypothetical protein [Streptomyces globosus]AXE22660.1 hypothetical protein C0216_03670 [Streptomyces globosus]
MRTKPRTTTGAVAAALLPALVLGATACGSGPGSGKAPDQKGSAPVTAPAGTPSAGTSPAPAAPPSGGSRLERSALAPGDLPGYQVSAQGKNPAAPDGQPQADRRTCQPLADIMGDKPDPAARETVNRGIGSQKEVGLAVSASVSSYAERDAKALVSRLKDAVAACGTGFTATVQNQSGSYRDVRAAGYRTAGDDTVSWTTTAAAQGVSAHVHVVVVREGDTIVRLMALNVAAAGQQAQVPQEVADKQLEKVRRAA